MDKTTRFANLAKGLEDDLRALIRAADDLETCLDLYVSDIEDVTFRDESVQDTYYDDLGDLTRATDKVGDFADKAYDVLNADGGVSQAAPEALSAIVALRRKYGRKEVA